jgi:hypothetical protein
MSRAQSRGLRTNPKHPARNAKTNHAPRKPLWYLLDTANPGTTHPRSHAPRGNAVPDAPRRPRSAKPTPARNAKTNHAPRKPLLCIMDTVKLRTSHPRFHALPPLPARSSPTRSRDSVAERRTLPTAESYLHAQKHQGAHSTPGHPTLIQQNSCLVQTHPVLLAQRPTRIGPSGSRVHEGPCGLVSRQRTRIAPRGAER